MTDKTDKKTETGKNVQVETTVKPERDPVANPKLPEKEAAKTASVEDIAPKSEPAAPMPPPKNSEKAVEKPSQSGGGRGAPPSGPALGVAPGGSKKAKSAAGPVLVTAVVVAALAGATIWYLHQQNQRHSHDLQQQLQANIRASNQANEKAERALSQLQAQQQRLQALERSLASSQEQTADLHQAFQTLTDAGTEVVLLNDIDHLVTIAQQQLLLGGNVANAIVSLETAQARLARANRPTLASLQQTINGDLDRLRASSTTDVASLSRQLEQLADQLSSAPLLMPDDVHLSSQDKVESNASAFSAESSASLNDNNPDAPWWERTASTAWHWAGQGWAAVRHDLGEFITVRRVDDASALLMSPEQANRFRDSLRLRVSSAKLALMTNQPSVWKAETAAIVNALEQRFDSRSSATASALQNAVALSQIDITTELPSLDNSLSAIEALLQAKGTTAPDASHSGATEPEQSSPDSNETEAEPVEPEQLDPQTEEQPAEATDDSATQDDNVQAGAWLTPTTALHAGLAVHL